MWAGGWAGKAWTRAGPGLIRTAAVVTRPVAITRRRAPLPLLPRQEVHGSGEIPPDYRNPTEPDWVEAGRWLERQRELYRRQKLLLVRVRLIKEALGAC